MYVYIYIYMYLGRVAFIVYCYCSCCKACTGICLAMFWPFLQRNGCSQKCFAINPLSTGCKCPPCSSIPGHALHEKGLQRQKGVGPLVTGFSPLYFCMFIVFDVLCLFIGCFTSGELYFELSFKVA